jgi:hypothetical protein
MTDVIVSQRHHHLPPVDTCPKIERRTSSRKERKMSESQTEEIRPDADMAMLEPLIGTWELSGDTTVSDERAMVGFFLVQHFDMTCVSGR